MSTAATGNPEWPGGRPPSCATASLARTPVATCVFGPLARLRRRCRLYLAIAGAFHLGVAFLVAGLGQLLLDRTLRLSLDQRAVTSVIITLVWLTVLYRSVLRRLLTPLSDLRLAVVVDRANPQLQDYLASAVQFASGRVHRLKTGATQEANSRELLRAVLDEACAATAGVAFLDVLDHRRAGRRGAMVGGIVLVIALAWTLQPRIMHTWFQRNWLLKELPWPQRTVLQPVGFDSHGRRRVPLGDELELAAIVKGVVPTTARVQWWTERGARGRQRMTLVGNTRFETSLGVLNEDVHFELVGGDEHTRAYVVEAVERPRVIRTTARITPPAYTGLEAVTVEQQTVLELLRGAALEIEAWVNKPVARAEFCGAGPASGQVAAATGPVAPCEVLGGNRVRVEWSAPVSGSYRFVLADRDGWEDLRPVSFTIKVVPDEPPVAKLELRGVGEFITPSAELDAGVSFEDAYGLATAGLRVQKGDGAAAELGLEGFTPGERVFRATPRVAARTVDVVPGERLRLWAEAADNDPNGPNVGQSVAVVLRVLAIDDFATEMARRELELRREFERLVSSQRALKDALDRVSASRVDTAHQTGAAPDATAEQRLTALARRQDTQALECAAIADRFAQILAEMWTSKVARAADERRLGDRVVAPLRGLAEESMPAAAAAIAEFRQHPEAERRSAMEAAQADVLRQMQAVLANMLEWEGYREAVALLQEIIDEQRDLRTATLEELEVRLRAILELEESDAHRLETGATQQDETDEVPPAGEPNP